MQICGCNKPDCKICKQQAPFLAGKQVREEDKNFLQSGPRLENPEQATAFYKLPKEDDSAGAFKRGADEYFSSLSIEEAKQAKVFMNK